MRRSGTVSRSLLTNRARGRAASKALMASFLNLRLRDPLAYEQYQDGSTVWDITLNFQAVDTELKRADARLTAVEDAVSTLGGSPGVVDAGTF